MVASVREKEVVWLCVQSGGLELCCGGGEVSTQVLGGSLRGSVRLWCEF